MSSASSLLNTIQQSPNGLTLAQLINLHSDIARRTAQRWISQWLDKEQITAFGAGRARRYLPGIQVSQPAFEIREPEHPDYLPLSVDSRDILAYISQPLAARDPVGYQIDFLESYRPNHSCYLSAPLRQQLRKMGDSGQMKLPAGTYGRAILNRLLIDLSWASSNLEGNTYTRLETRKLIEQGDTSDTKTVIETQMILNHKAAIELLVENVDSVSFNRYTLLNLHSTLSENLLPNPQDEAGFASIL